MHPPLDRPHPDCQDAVQNLKNCHVSRLKWKFWACNEMKFELDRCFREEKQAMMKRINAEFYEERANDNKLVGTNWEDYWTKKKIEKDSRNKHAEGSK